MSTMVKYRVHEVAKDFGLTSKVITEILTKYATTPKNHMQVLEDRELDIIFEYLTSTNQMESIAEVFADAAPKAEEKKPAADEKKAETSTPEKKAGAAAPAQADGKPAQPKKEEKPRQPKGQPQKRVIDTSGVTINIEKYNERFEDMAGDRTRKNQNARGGKEKIKQKPGRQQQNQTQSNKRRQEERDRMQRLQFEIAKKAPVKVQIPDEINVGELASRMKKTGAEVVKTLMKNGVMASLSDVIDFDTAAIIAEEMGCKVEREVIVTIEEKLIDDTQDNEDELLPRAPVVVVMGHVDHGKTSLLDYIRKAHVASGEAGGITQHIGAYTVTVNGANVTFLDTPGHEAFTSMRARGAMVTDIAILVVAADDGIMPQTIESINHAKAAKIPIVVAINKMDVHGANPERIKQQLTEYDLVPEEWGGETIVCPISAKTGQGIDALLENLVLLAEVQELKANPNRAAKGTVIEARLDKGRGPIMTVLVQNGTLKQGDIIIAGTAVGRVRTMLNDKGELKELPIIVKADVQGSAEAVKTSLEKLTNDEVRVKVIHSAVGAINESDVMLATTSGAIIVGFNVRPDAAAKDSAARNHVDMRMYRVIYDCINEIEDAMKGMLAPKFRENIIGHAEVRETYKVSKVGTVCGCYVQDGKIQRGCSVRVLRDNVVVHEGELASLRRFKDDVREVASGYECGMQVEKFNDVKIGDVIECFVMEEIKA